MNIGHTRLNGIVEVFEAQVRFGRALVQFGDVVAPTFALLLPPVENAGKDGFQPFGLEKLVLKMIGDQIVQLLHRHGLPSQAVGPCRAFIEQA